MQEFLKTTVEKLKRKPIFLYGFSLVMLFPLATFIVYYFRVLYEPVWLKQLEFTICLFFALAVIFTLLFALFRNYEKKPHLVLATIVFIIAVLFALTTPINQVADENVHFLRSQTMAQGQFGFDENHEFPRDTMVLMESFPNMYLNGYSYSIAQHYEMYFDNLSDEEHTPDQISIIIFQVFAYIPQTIGIIVARITGFGAMGAFYFSRIFNALFFSICAYYSFTFASRFKIILFTVMLIPISIYTVGSANSDSVLFGLMFLALSAVLSDNFNMKKLVLFMVCMAILIVSKATYIVFLPIVFAICSKKWKVRFKNKNISKLFTFFAAVCFALIVYQLMGLYVQLFSNYGVIERTMDSTDPAMQLTFILQNPMRYLVTFVELMIEYSFFLFQGGLFGWLDANIDIVSNFAVIFVLINVFKQSSVFDKQDKNIVFGFAVTSLLTYGVAITGLYLSWSPVGHIDIIGVQMRYFVPAFVGAALALGFYFNRFTRGNKANCDISCAGTMCALNIFAVIMNFSLYYLR